jgi:V8-like Glu-specific endopeptidase
MFHREIVDIHKCPLLSIGKISAIGYSSGQLCTGAVISPNVFLTAAHCLCNTQTARFTSASSIHIFIGYEKAEYRAHRVTSQYTMPPALDPSAFAYRPVLTPAAIRPLNKQAAAICLRL